MVASKSKLVVITESKNKFHFINIQEKTENFPEVNNNASNNTDTSNIAKSNDSKNKSAINKDDIKFNEFKKQLEEEENKNQILLNENKLLKDIIVKLNIELYEIKGIKEKLENGSTQKNNELQKILPQ